MRSLFSSQTRSTSRRNRSTRARPAGLERLEGRELLTAVAPPSGLISWWTGDNMATDLKGPNNASLFNGANYVVGKVGQAINFDGVDDRAQVVDSDSLKLTGSFTIEAWVRVDTFTPNNGGIILFRGDDRGGLDPYQLNVDSTGNLRLLINSLTGGASVQAPIPLGVFTHVAATLDDASGSMRLYVNGALAAESYTTVRPFRDLDPASNPSIGIGNHGGYPTTPHNFPLDGVIDELSVYNRAITPGEVQGIYSADSAGKIRSTNYFAADYPTVTEGSAATTTTATFTVNRVGSLVGQAVVNWTTADGTATAGSDYVAASGQLDFLDGESQKTVQVTVNGDNTPETNETFWLALSTSTPGYTAGGGLATITDDDATISISDASAIEGNQALQFKGRFVADASGGLGTPRGSIFGADGNGDGAQDFYVTSGATNAILRYDGVTGAFIDAFVPPGVGGLVNPIDLAFGPDGNLYVSTGADGKVLKFDASGASLGVVVSGLVTPLGLTFGLDGSLFIADQGTDQVLRYNGSGLSVFVSAGSGGLDQPRQAVFGPDGNLYVASQGTGAVLRYNGTTGAFINTFATTNIGPGPTWLEFGADGYLYVTARTTSVGSNTSLLRFDAATGALVDRLDLARDGWSFIVGPDGLVYFSGNGAGAFVDRVGPSSLAAFTVSLSIPSAAPITVNYTTADGTALAGGDFVATSGTLTFAPGQTSRTILIPTTDDAVGEPTETFTITLSNPVGASIADGVGVGTIIDNDPGPTKFYVVNDATSNQTYEYAANGTAVENYVLNSGNTAPRGAASTAAGTTVWVVDANRKVYVYNTAGESLGSWTAGTLATNATVEGITTNGTDVWIVDAKSDKVFKYTGAATRTSGSQNAASSFSLNSGNASPKDIVTDGTSLWVVNDSTTDKVFKYSLTGSLLGSWTITGAGTSPTGITLDPTGGGTLWTVDSWTDRVYQFDNARGLTSGSLSPSSSFALAAGNTNPQGIADPPTPGTPRVAVSRGTAHPSGHLASHHRRTFPGRQAAKPISSSGRSTATSPSITNPQVTPILIPLTPWTVQDLTSVGTGRSHTGTKRGRIAIRV